jgi:hypothetical protein
MKIYVAGDKKKASEMQKPAIESRVEKFSFHNAPAALQKRERAKARTPEYERWDGETRPDGWRGRHPERCFSVLPLQGEGGLKPALQSYKG